MKFNVRCTETGQLTSLEFYLFCLWFCLSLNESIRRALCALSQLCHASCIFLFSLSVFVFAVEQVHISLAMI